MKNLILITIALVYFTASAQNNNDCIKTRWISVKNVEPNKLLFDTDQSMLRIIKDKAESYQVELNHGVNTSRELGKWYPISYSENELSELIDMGVSLDDFFQISVQSDIPLIDEFGDNIIIEDQDGNQSFAYEPAEVYIFHLEDLREIRIREERVFNESEKVYEDEFVATGISFVIDYQSFYAERFWINLDQLYKSMTPEELEKTVWYKILTNREYEGFQYLQVECDGELIPY